MTARRAPAQGVALAAALALVADLFAGWRRASVHMAGVFDVHATSSGWSGWGLVAGVLALAVAGLVFWRGDRLALLLAGAGTLMATVLAVVTGDAHVHVAGMMSTAVGGPLWPAWLGLALAAVVAVSSAIAYTISAERARV